jgi:folate-binding protein YgfZ
MTMTRSSDAFEALSAGAVLVDRSSRVRLEVSGPDRARFLQNLTTQEVKRFPAGEGREAFVTSPQGKTLGYVTLLSMEDRMLLRTEREGFPPVLPHLTRYGVFDEVVLDDLSERTFEFHLAGPAAEEVARRAGADLPGAGELRHLATSVVGAAVRVVRESPSGRAGLTLIGDRAEAGAVLGVLGSEGKPLGLVAIDTETFEPLRIEAGTPAAGRDVTPDNLPQEVARDDRTIDFVKGCYLGQETVARIDALGHVNKLLRGLLIPGDEPPPPGSKVEADGKAVGVVTSSAYSPPLGRVVALGYVRTTHARHGTPVRIALGGQGDAGRYLEAVVTDLPMPAE